jgi:LysM repeat protein
MKRISILLVTCSLWLAPGAPAQDAATQERLDKLSGKIEDLLAAQEITKKQIAELGRELEAVRAQASKPQPTYASHEDLKRVADAVTEESRKRVEDYDKIRAELKSLGRALAAPTPTPKIKNPPAAPPSGSSGGDKPTEPPGDQKGYEYKVKSGDTLSTILQAYREQNIKVKLDEVLRANPGLKPEKLKAGQTIFIPAPRS